MNNSQNTLALERIFSALPFVVMLYLELKNQAEIDSVMRVICENEASESMPVDFPTLLHTNEKTSLRIGSYDVICSGRGENPVVSISLSNTDKSPLLPASAGLLSRVAEEFQENFGILRVPEAMQGAFASVKISDLLVRKILAAISSWHEENV